MGERYVPSSSDKPGGARWRRFGRRVWNSTNVHHTTRDEVVYMGAGQSKAGQREAEELILRVRRILQRRLVIIWRAGFDRKKWTVG